MLALVAMACDKGESKQACLDVADAAGNMAARCLPEDPDAYDAMHDGVLDVVDGDCGNVVNIRNIDELYDECLPWMQDVDCSLLVDPDFQLDTSCEGQLLI